MNRRNTVMIWMLLLGVLACAEDSDKQKALLEYGDFELYLGQNVKDVRDYFGNGELRQNVENSPSYIFESFSEGTSIKYNLETGEIFHIRTTNQSAQGPIPPRVGDPRDLLEPFLDKLFVSGDYYFYTISLEVSGPVDPLFASVVYIVRNGVISEIQINYDVE